MIINIRGTSGSGKSTIVRSVMSHFETKRAYKMEGRKQPIGYVLESPEKTKLAVIGHYETACGGCDTISGMDKIFDLVRASAAQGYNVLFEGLLISSDTKRTIALRDEGNDLIVFSLGNVPIDECVAGINARRLERMGPEKFTPVAEKNTRAKYGNTASAMKKLTANLIDARTVGRDDGLDQILEALDI